MLGSPFTLYGQACQLLVLARYGLLFLLVRQVGAPTSSMHVRVATPVTPVHPPMAAMHVGVPMSSGTAMRVGASVVRLAGVVAMAAVLHGQVPPTDRGRGTAVVF